jgi:cellulose synthase/poly-beta-1,6-N-acetylglucosamine synthase-like glycosyltransferase
VFHPPNLASSVTSTRWQLVHVLACAVSFFGLLGMAGLYARQAVKSGWLGLAGYVLFSLWLVLIMGFSFVEAFILPRVATASPSFVHAWMGMFTGPKGSFDLGVLPTIWTLTGPVYILGGLLFGVATFRSRILPRWAGALLAVGTVLAPIASQLPNASQPKVAIPVGVALAWLGYALWSERQTQDLPTAQPTRRSAVV